MFPDLVFSEETDRVIGKGRNVERLRELLRNQRIRDTARDVLIRHRRGNEVSFTLNKQAAFVGRVNFGLDSPLGTLRVTILDDNLDALIDYVAESTVGRRLTGSHDRSAGT